MLTRPLGDDAGGPMRVDGAYNWFRNAHGDMTTLASARPFAVQRPSRTDIHDLRWYDRIPVVQQLAGYARKKKHALRQR